MRVYIAATPSQLSELITSKICSFVEYLTPAQFEFPSDMSEEEREDFIAQLASEDSAELNQDKNRFVIAADLTADQAEAEIINLKFEQLAALLVGEELAWYGPDEIEHELQNWKIGRAHV